MVNAYVGSPYKLVFPLLSSGYLNLDYDISVTQVEPSSDNVGTPTANTISDVRNRNPWDNTGAFTIECIITPYDVNGSARHGNAEFGVLDSTKTPPYPSDSLSSRASTYESTSILGTSSTTKYTISPNKLMIFHNTNVQLYLENTTDNSYNQPAEYKIVAKFKSTNGTFQTLETDTVIKAENKLTGYYDPYGYYVGNTTSLTKLDTATGNGTASTLTLGTASNINLVGKGTELFNSSGVSIGKVVGTNILSGSGAGVITMDKAQSSTTVYYSQLKEALYLDQMYKISFTYLKHAAEIYLDNSLQVSTQHLESNVTLHPSDCKIGKGSSASEQFYGEIYEIAMHSGNAPNLSTTKTLSPSYSNILFYYRFGE